jgi:hypothetical protein
MECSNLLSSNNQENVVLHKGHMEKIKIILVVTNAETRDRYLQEIKNLPIDLSVVDSLEKLHSQLVASTFQGILIDFPTKALATTQEKEKMQQVFDLYPAMLMRWEKYDNSVVGCARFKGIEVDSIAEFVSQICSSFNARSIRSSARHAIQLNVILKLPGQAEPLRTITQNVSSEGCFIITSEMFANDDSCTFLMTDLNKERWITGKICWRSPWGICTRFPGLGILFPSEAWIIERFNNVFIGNSRRNAWTSVM